MANAAPLSEEIRSAINCVCLHRRPFTTIAPARPGQIEL
jgi:hypothetical protein